MVKIIAHRGARSLSPENTLIAAKIACNMGAHLWETDVNVTKDNQLVLFHDQFLDRCTDVVSKFSHRMTTRLKDFNLKEVLSLDAGSYFVDTDPFLQIKHGHINANTLAMFKNEKIPTLEQGLALVQDMDWAVNLELKSFSFNKQDFLVPDKTVEMIQKAGISMDRIIISSFNHDWLVRVRQKEPDLEVAALVGENDTDSLNFANYSFSTYNINAKLVTSDQIQHLKTLGKKINLFTVNDPKEFARFSLLGVDGIFTDFPQLFCPAKG
jgi:glycerophosphoryl diester phosphodiesterase